MTLPHRQNDLLHPPTLPLYDKSSRVFQATAWRRAIQMYLLSMLLLASRG